MILEIKNYIKISNSIDEILKNSPFKLKYIIEKSGISEPTFFRKMKEKKFLPEELLKIAEIIEPENPFYNLWKKPKMISKMEFIILMMK